MDAFSEMETEVVIAARGLPDARIAEELGIIRGDGRPPPGKRLPEDRGALQERAVRMALMEQWIEIGEITDAAESDDSSGG